jgi:hypothetical protein
VIGFDGADLTVLASFYAYSSIFTGGVHVASAETPHEGQAAIVLAQEGFRGRDLNGYLVNGYLVNGLRLAQSTGSWTASVASSSRVTLPRLARSSPAPRDLSRNGGRRQAARAPPPGLSYPWASPGFSARARDSPT